MKQESSQRTISQWSHADLVVFNNAKMTRPVIESSTGVVEASLDILTGDAGIITQDFVGALALGKEIDNEFNSKAGAFDNWLANEDVRIEGNVGLPIHKGT